MINQANQITNNEIYPAERERNSFYNSRNWYDWQASIHENQASWYESQARNMRNEVPNMRRNKDAALVQGQDAQGAVNRLTVERTKLQSEVQSANARLSTTRSSAGNAAQRRAQLQARLNQLRTELKQLETGNARFAATSQAQEGRLSADVTQKGRTLAVKTAAYEKQAAALRASLKSVTDAKAAAAAEKAAAEKELAQQKQRANAAAAALTSTRSKIANARTNAEKLARDVLAKAKKAKADAEDSMRAADVSLQEAKTNAAAAEDLAARRLTELQQDQLSQGQEVRKWEGALATLKQLERDQSLKFVADKQRWRGELTELRTKQAALSNNLATAAGKLKAAMAARAQEIRFFTQQLADETRNHGEVRNHTLAGHAVIQKQRAELEKAVAHAIEVHDVSVLALAAVGARLDNNTRTAEAAIALLTSEKALSEAAYAKEEESRAAQVKALQEAIAAAGARRTAVETTAAQERGAADKLLQQQSDAARDAQGEREGRRAAEDRRFLGTSADLRASVSALQHEVEALQDKHAAAKAAAEGVAAQLAEARRSLGELESERSHIVEAVAALQRKRVDLRAAAEEAAAKVEAGSSEIEATEGALGDALQAVKRATAENAGSERHVEALKAAVARAQQQLREAGRASAALGADMERVKTVQATIDRLAGAIAEANRRLDAAESAKTAMQRQIADLTERKGAAEATVAEMAQRLTQRKTVAGVATGSDAELREKEAALKAEAAEAATKAQAKAAALAAEAAAARKKAAAETATLQAALQEAQGQRTALLGELAAARSKAAAANGQGAAADGSADKKAAELASAQVAALARSLRERIAALDGVVSDLQRKQSTPAAATPPTRPAQVGAAAAQRSAGAPAVDSDGAPETSASRAADAFSTPQYSHASLLLPDQASSGTFVSASLDRPVKAPSADGWRQDDAYAAAADEAVLGTATASRSQHRRSTLSNDEWAASQLAAGVRTSAVLSSQDSGARMRVSVGSAA